LVLVDDDDSDVVLDAGLGTVDPLLPVVEGLVIAPGDEAIRAFRVDRAHGGGGGGGRSATLRNDHDRFIDDATWGGHRHH
jgi:hypothetical protein